MAERLEMDEVDGVYANRIPSRNNISARHHGEETRVTVADSAADDYYEVDPGKVVVTNKLLGNGHFGDVVVGLLTKKDGRPTPVAVKRLKMKTDRNLSREQQAEIFRRQLENLKREKRIMAVMGRHVNILRLIAAITNPNDFCIITEYCVYGSLDKFLEKKENGKTFINEYIANDNANQLLIPEFHWKMQNDSVWKEGFEARRKEEIITTTDLLWFGWQIANAMNFLISQSILHRDIALRNILLADDYIVKVADFGLSRRTIDGTYQPTNPTPMPVGYSAPEVLESGSSTEKSERWAFGVALWELFTLAKRRPYVEECGFNGAVNAQDLITFLETGKRLPVPEYAPISMRELMEKLWSDSPDKRPDFDTCQSTIFRELQIANPILAERAEKMQLPNDREHPKSSHVYEMVNRLFTRRSITCVGGVNSKVQIFCCVLSFLLISAITIGFLFWLWPRGPEPYQTKWIPARWSWPINVSDISDAQNNESKPGPEYKMSWNSAARCDSIKWRPLYYEYESSRITVLLKYTEGPSNLLAMRSMLMITQDGREVMAGNDFHRSTERHRYNMGSYDEHTFALNSTLLNKNDTLLTLKIEVFIDSTSTDCKYILEPPRGPINYQEECERLPTQTKLFKNGSCYVGSNTQAQFAFAYELCNDIPFAAVARLAWIESDDLLDDLRKVMKIHRRTGEIVNPPYYIGAKYFPEKDERALREGWNWITNDLRAQKSIAPEFLFSNQGKKTEAHKLDHDYAVIFKSEEYKLSAVPVENWNHYLCEYRSEQ